jgi:tetratricopeptide (TPR) repeat protein
MASPLLRSRSLLKQRRFSAVLETLEPCLEDYADSFECFYLLGTASLYLGMWGNAERYYGRARKLSLTDVRLLLGRGVLHLRLCETDRALGCYLEAQDRDPRNRTIQRALNCIKRHGHDHSYLTELSERGKLRRLYPPLGANPRAIRWGILAAVVGVGLFFAMPALTAWLAGGRNSREAVSAAEWAQLELSAEEGKNAASGDLSTGVFRYILTTREVTASYERAKGFFQAGRDNAAQVEINRILGSNAAPSIRQKARLLMSYLSEPTFDTLSARDRYTYKEVASDPELYLDCWVQWSGMVSNLREGRADFLVGYDTRSAIEGIVGMTFSVPLVTMDVSRPVKVLAKVDVDEGRLVVAAKSVYQPL